MNQSQQTNASPWMTVDEAAEYGGWNKSTVYKLISQGRIRAYRLSGLRVRREDIDQALESNPAVIEKPSKPVRRGRIRHVEVLT
jgi:excisionase family DNA binding protein